MILNFCFKFFSIGKIVKLRSQIFSIVWNGGGGIRFLKAKLDEQKVMIEDKGYVVVHIILEKV